MLIWLKFIKFVINKNYNMLRDEIKAGIMTAIQVLQSAGVVKPLIDKFCVASWTHYPALYSELNAIIRESNNPLHAASQAPQPGLTVLDVQVTSEDFFQKKNPLNVVTNARIFGLPDPKPEAVNPVKQYSSFQDMLTGYGVDNLKQLIKSVKEYGLSIHKNSTEEEAFELINKSAVDIDKAQDLSSEVVEYLPIASVSFEEQTKSKKK